MKFLWYDRWDAWVVCHSIINIIYMTWLQMTGRYDDEVMLDTLHNKLVDVMMRWCQAYLLMSMIDEFENISSTSFLETSHVWVQNGCWAVFRESVMYMMLNSTCQSTHIYSITCMSSSLNDVMETCWMKWTTHTYINFIHTSSTGQRDMFICCQMNVIDKLSDRSVGVIINITQQLHMRYDKQLNTS